MSSARGCVYRNNMRGSRCPLIRATSGTLRPFSKNLLTASCRRSCDLRFTSPVRLTSLFHAIFAASCVIGRMRSSPDALPSLKVFKVASLWVPIPPTPYKKTPPPIFQKHGVKPAAAARLLARVRFWSEERV